MVCKLQTINLNRRWRNHWPGGGRPAGEIAFPGVYVVTAGSFRDSDFPGCGEVFVDEWTDTAFTAQG